MDAECELAMCRVIDDLAGQVAPVAFVALLKPRGLGLHGTSWPALLGCGEEEILESLRRHWARVLDRCVNDIASCDTGISREMLSAVRKFRADSAAIDEWIEHKTRRTWDQAQAGIAGPPGHAPESSPR